METPSLDGLPTKAKEDPPPYEMGLCPAGHQPSISWSRGVIIIIIVIVIIIIYYLLILLLIYFVLTCNRIQVSFYLC